MNHYKAEKQSFTILTMVEIIAVVAIVIVLAAAIAPQISKTIDKSKVTDLLALVKRVQGSCAVYYTDLGTMLPLSLENSNGIVIESDGSSESNSLDNVLVYEKSEWERYGKWARFNGPYLDSFDGMSPPLGVTMRLSSMHAYDKGEKVDALNERNFSLDGDGYSDIDSNSIVVALVIDGVTPKQWRLVEEGYTSESSMDGSESELKARGRIKYSSEVADGRLIIYVVHN